ncbi:MAG: hypothetical protein JST59_03320 [Actinobacteria bacterium]|nr:hypothetical protein [Actinomycetota bacterium]
MRAGRKAHVLHAALFAALLFAIVLVATTVVPAGAGAQSKNGGKAGGSGKSRRAIASPRPGQQIKTNSLRLIVNAGPEREDLRAKLNGVAIGRRFGVNQKRHRRYLSASLVDGLRRGKNTLVVWVRQKYGRYRKSKVTFVVAHGKPMASAGQDVSLAVGSEVELHGQVLLPEAKVEPAKAGASAAGDGAPGASSSSWAEVAAGGNEVEWSIVDAPPDSHLTMPLATIVPADGQPTGLEEAHTLSPMFVPDAPGTYELKMIVRGPSGTSVDHVDGIVGPETPLLTFNTEVKAGDNNSRPAVRVGPETFPAPYMRTAGGTKNYAGTGPEGTQYKAIWQVISLDRTTLEPKWNRTYGLCRSGSSGSWSTCRLAESGAGAGLPVPANLNEDLAATTNAELIVAASHAGSEWAPPAEGNFVEKNFAPIGFPKENDPEIGAQIVAAKAGEMAGVGIKGLSQGEAKIMAGTGTPGMSGYLTADGSAPQPHYGFISSQRIPFDTRASSSCSAETCTVTQQIGGGSTATGAQGSVPADKGGYLIAGYNRLTLKPIESRTFVTTVPYEEPEGNRGPPRKALEEIPGYLAGLASKNAIVMITSIHGNKQPKKVFYQHGTPNWKQVMNEVVKLGGTREEFVKGLSTPGADYSLVGLANLPEGAGPESSTAGARLRGFFSPDNDSLYGPESVNPNSKPASLLMAEVLRAPGTEAWPGENEPEVMKAMAYIGTPTILGADPRYSYWHRIETEGEAERARHEAEAVTYKDGQGFSPAAFTKAMAYLKTELGMVAKARGFEAVLASPAGGGKEAWGTAFQLSTELSDLQKKLEAQAKAKASIGQFFNQLLQAVLTAAGQGEIVAALKYAEEIATTGQLGAEIYNTLNSGAEGKPSQEVEAATLANKLAAQAVENEESIQRFFDILISDWSKLQVVGTVGGCNPNKDCGPNREYIEFAYEPGWAKAAKISAKQAAERELYTRLVPLVFPIWKLEPMTDRTETDLSSHFYCHDTSYPLYRAPQKAYFKSPAEYSTNAEWGPYPPLFYRVYLAVRRDGLTYGYPSEAILNKMFNPLETVGSETAGLEMNPGDFMREGNRIAPYYGPYECEWY